MRSARKVTVSRAPSTGAPSPTRPRNASRGRKAAPSGRIRCSDPHASQLTSSPVVRARPVGVQGGWFTGTRTSRASAATVATRSRSAWALAGVASRRGSAFGADLPRTARARVQACWARRRYAVSRKALERSSERIASTMTWAKVPGASNGTACAVPSISRTAALGMAWASERVMERM